MTLFKQIAIVFSMFIILIIASVMYLNFTSANQFIQNQLYATSEDTATSLGLSLSMNIPSEGENLATMETIINAIFDRGYYESIILTDMEGHTLIENKNSVKVKNIPDWFIRDIDLQIPTAKSQISSGWMPYGIISVKLHGGHAYTQLWNIFVEILQTFAVLVSTVLAILYFLLKFILKSLKGVEDQAIAITNNDFIIQETIPFTTEFKNVVKGMNKMVKKVKDIFEHEALMVQKYNDLLYNDQDTGMGNRKFFSLRLSSLLNQQDAKSGGTIVIFVLNNFFETKKIVGYKILSNYVNRLAELFYETTNEVEERVVTRLKDSEFSMILPETNYEKAEKIVDDFLKEADKALPDELRKISEFYISGGATYFDEKDKQKDILARADFALSTAKMKSETNVHFHKIINDESLMELGQEEWYRLITTAIKKDGIKLALQAVKDDNGKIYHNEAYLRMSNETGTIYPARVFMPMLTALNLIDEVDKKVIDVALKLAQRGTNIAINITASFIKNSENIYWLEDIFKKSTTLNLKIAFESSNYAIVHNLDNYNNFSKLIQKYNYEFGIDNFSITDTSLSYLQELKPAYIKANKSFYIDMYDEGKNSSYESFNILTKSLDIKVIATAVENQEESDSLKEIPISLMQGAFIEEPTL
ncbi:MAG: EAL domain-containing protein [Sulfurimonas sp.]|nr:EAL domain-containing protein [Sulfurimonas sp.]